VISLDDMALFVEVVKAKGFRAASEASGIPNSTLSRRISALEKSIGLRLLHRTTRKIELTETGQIYFERCNRIVAEAHMAHEQLGEMLTQPSGVLRVSLPVDFAVTYLSPLITEFAGMYPGIKFDFDLSPKRVDLVSERFDVAIRIGKSEDSQLIARRLALLTFCLYASPGYLKRSGEPTEPNELEQYECLTIAKGDYWELYDGKRTARIRVDGRFKLNSVNMLRRLAALDMGIVMLPEEIVADELAHGKLQRIMPMWQGNLLPVYAMTETRLLPAKTRLFVDFLCDRLGGLHRGVLKKKNRY
tara:strand:- start:1198 stop:2106 length:909 start_codon:yes stop_codon:yes gene_type:complete